jgi:hypothetical protein
MMLNEKTIEYQVKRVAEKFVAAFAHAAGHADHVTAYMHTIQCHVSKFIQSYGYLSNYGCRGSEHMDANTKRSFTSESSQHPKKRAQEAMNAIRINIHHDADLPTPERKRRMTCDARDC